MKNELNRAIFNGLGKVRFAKDLASFQVAREILDVWMGIAIMDCVTAYHPVIAAQMPVTWFLGTKLSGEAQVLDKE